MNVRSEASIAETSGCTRSPLPSPFPVPLQQLAGLYAERIEGYQDFEVERFELAATLNESVDAR
jgi:hypothetical protein